ncbi:MAG: hypothetical protein SVM80_08870 [Halobacteriota archaeon]|nr:hypothetical protein [Halobacteriota archaeon]
MRRIAMVFIIVMVLAPFGVIGNDEAYCYDTKWILAEGIGTNIYTHEFNNGTYYHLSNETER